MDMITSSYGNQVLHWLNAGRVVMQQLTPWRFDDASATSKALGGGVDGADGATSNGKTRCLANHRGRRQAELAALLLAALLSLELSENHRNIPDADKMRLIRRACSRY